MRRKPAFIRDLEKMATILAAAVAAALMMAAIAD